MTTKEQDKPKYFIELFKYLSSTKSKYTKEKKLNEEFYFSDVEGTGTQFTTKQLQEIQAKYDIPISSKLTYAIVEQLLAFLTGAKPYPQLTTNTDTPEASLFKRTFEELFSNIWSESNADNELYLTLRDMFTTGSGYVRPRKNDFYNESTFNCIIENVPWTDLYIDPTSRRSDLQDAEVICIARGMSVQRAENEYDIVLNQDDWNQEGDLNTGLEPTVEGYEYIQSWDLQGMDKKKKFVIVKEFFEKKHVHLYITDKDQILAKKPIPIKIPNPEKQQLGLQMQQMQQQMQGMAQQAQNQNPDEAGLAGDAMQQGEQMVQQLGMMEQAYMQMPDMVPALKGETETGGEVICFSVVRVKKRRIERTLQIGRKIIEEEVMPVDIYPIHHFTLSHLRNPNRTFGIVHYIKDVVKAYNKFLSLAIYNLQIAGSPKVFYAQGTVADPVKFEQHLSVPGSVNEWVPDPTLPDGGRPQIVDGLPLQQSFVQLIGMMTQLAEYITGIYGVMQGNGNDAPATLGATQSLQSFGTQRIKLASRGLELPLSQLMYSTISLLRKYIDRDKLALIDANGDQQELAALEMDNLEFRARIQITNSLPTSRQMAATLLATLAGQTANPAVQDLLLESSLKFMDIKEADEIKEKVDVVKQMQSQMEGLQQQTKDLDSQLRAAQNNLAQKDIALEASKAKMQIESESALAQKDVQMEAELQKAQMAQGQPDQFLNDPVF
jgi:hypothetical protein